MPGELLPALELRLLLLVPGLADDVARLDRYDLSGVGDPRLGRGARDAHHELTLGDRAVARDGLRLALEARGDPVVDRVGPGLLRGHVPDDLLVLAWGHGAEAERVGLSRRGARRLRLARELRITL